MSSRRRFRTVPRTPSTGRRAAAALLSVALLLACAPPEHRSRVRPGEPAPRFDLQDLAGGRLALQDLRGRVVLVDFWATYCASCKDSIPFFRKLHKEFHQAGLVVLGVSIDERTEHLRGFVSEAAMPYRVLLDREQAAARAYGITGVPESFLIGRDGIVRGTWVGFSPEDARQIRMEVRAALKDGP